MQAVNPTGRVTAGGPSRQRSGAEGDVQQRSVGSPSQQQRGQGDD